MCGHGHMAYRDGAICVPHRRARFGQHTVHSNLRSDVEEVLFQFSHDPVDPPRGHQRSEPGLKLCYGMHKDMYTVFSGGWETKQIEYRPGEAPYANDLQAAFCLKNSRLIEKAHQKWGRERLQVATYGNVVKISKIEDDLRVSIRLDLECSFLVSKLAMIIPKAFDGILKYLGWSKFLVHAAR